VPVIVYLHGLVPIASRVQHVLLEPMGILVTMEYQSVKVQVVLVYVKQDGRVQTVIRSKHVKQDQMANLVLIKLL